jgi:hypothetical protein
MTALDAAKEQIFYAKLLLAIMLGAGVLLANLWLSNKIPDALFAQSLYGMAVAAIAVGIVLTHLRIMRSIAALKDL